MGNRVTIRNDEPPGGPCITVAVVTVGSLDGQDVKEVLQPGNEVQLTLQRGQFALIDDTEQNEGA